MSIPPLDAQRLHRQRKGRRPVVRVLDHDELAARFRMRSDDPEALKRALAAAGWRYHQDVQGRLWAVPPREQTTATGADAPTDDL